MRATNIKKYGVPYASQNKKVLNKIKETCLKKYGEEHPMKVKNFVEKCNAKYYYNGCYFDSSWELASYIYAVDHNLNITRLPQKISYINPASNKEHCYWVDFMIDGKYYEAKGDHLVNSDGIWIPTTRELNRCTSEEDRYILKEKYKAKQKAAKDIGVHTIYKKEIKPIIEYIHLTYGAKYLNQFKQYKSTVDATKLVG